MLSSITLSTLKHANVELSALTTMSVDEILGIKGIGPKRLVEIQDHLTEVQLNHFVDKGHVNPVFIRPEKVDSKQFTIDMLEEVRTHVQTFEDRRGILRNAGYTDNVQYALGWIIHRMNSQVIVDLLNTMYADDQYLPVMVGKLAIRVDLGTLPVINFHYEHIKSIAAYQIFKSLIDLGYLDAHDKVIQERNEETGTVTWRTQTLVSFGTYQEDNSLYIPGVHMEPGVVMQRRHKVRAGGKALKLNGAEKKFLRSASTLPLRLVKIDPELVKQYIRQSKWYQKSLTAKSRDKKIDKTVLEDVVNKQAKKFAELQKVDRFYLSMWLDYRTRTYYDMSEMGFNPHGKQFETSLYELADPEIITDAGADALMYSAVVIVDGRTPHHIAIERFTADSDGYLRRLREEGADDMGEHLYNNRLADAIEDYYSGRPSHFLLGEDATNGGLQHGGIGFKAEKMMIPSNVGGHSEQLDSHENLQEWLNLEFREDAKDIHQPLLHGSAFKTIAGVMQKSIPQARDLLVNAYGREVLNISAIADWGTSIVNNEHTTLMWTTRDGFRAQSIAYTESVPLHLYALTNSTKTKMSQILVHKEMPLFKDAKGNVVYGSVGTDKSQGKQNKLRGLYANITHSIDGTALRAVHWALVEATGCGGFYKHDNFFAHPNYMPVIRHGYKSALVEEYRHSSYQTALEDIVSRYGDNRPPLPSLFFGKATEQMIVDSHYFLSA